MDPTRIPAQRGPDFLSCSSLGYKDLSVVLVESLSLSVWDQDTEILTVGASVASCWCWDAWGLIFRVQELMCP